MQRGGDVLELFRRLPVLPQEPVPGAVRAHVGKVSPSGCAPETRRACKGQVFRVLWQPGLASRKELSPPDGVNSLYTRPRPCDVISLSMLRPPAGGKSPGAT